MRKKLPFGIGQIENPLEMKLHLVILYLEQESSNKWN